MTEENVQQQTIPEEPPSHLQTPETTQTPELLGTSPSMPNISSLQRLGKSPSQATMIQIRKGNMLIQYQDKRNPLERIAQLEILKKHKEKLTQINKKGVQPKDQQSIALSQQITNNKKVINDLKTTRNKQMIEKDNNLLLKKLVEISMGKRSTIPGNPLRNSGTNQRVSIYPGLKKELSLDNVLESKPLKTARNVTTAQVKSLNNHVKKEELRRIERENKKIAEKIISIQPSLKALDLETDFNMHKSISEGLRRIKKRKIPMFEGKGGALPPIVDESIKEMPEKSEEIIEKKPMKSRYQSTVRRPKNQDLNSEAKVKTFEKYQSPYNKGAIKEFKIHQSVNVERIEGTTPDFI